jgi:WD40 repeat protein
MQPAARLDIAASAVTVLAWSPDGQTLAGSAGATDTRDYAIHLWHADGTPLATLVGHSERIPALAWSPDGRVLASGSADGTVRLWSATGAALHTLALPRQLIFGLAWSPDGQTLAVGAVTPSTATVGTPGRPAPITPGTVTLWSADGELRATLDPPRRTGGKFFRLAWSRDGSTLAGGAVTFAIWRADGTLVAAIDDSSTPSWGMALSSDGAVLATGDESGFLRLYTDEGVLFATLKETKVADLAFAPDGKTLAVGGGTLLDLAGAQVTRRDLPMRSVPQSNLAWSPDGARLVAGFSDETVQVWRADGRRGATLAGCGGIPSSVAWSPDGRTIAAMTENRHLCLWHP